MKGKCYYCGKELTERTIKRHMKNCSEMKKVVEEKMKDTKGLRDQFIISMKDKNAPSVYCIYVSIDADLQLNHLDKFIRDIWVECCGHSSAFTIDGKVYKDNSNEKFEMNFYLKDVLEVNKKFKYQYDFESATHLILEVVDIIEVSKEFSQIEIIARNNDEEGKGNSPRNGVCKYEGSKDAETEYLPKNTIEYKVCEKKPIFSDCNEVDLQNDNDQYDLDILSNHNSKEYNKDEKSFINMFLKGKNSFDLEELIESYPKKQIDILAKNIDMKLASSLNKSKAIEKYVSEYEACIKNKMNVFNEELYRILHNCVNNNGRIQISENNITEYGDKHAFLMNKGIIFPCMENGQPIFIMPQVMQNIVKQIDTIEFRKLMKNNSEILNVFKGMIEAYGILYFDDVKVLMAKYAPIEESTLFSLLEQGSYYNLEYYGAINDNGKIIFINDKIEDHKEIINEIDKDLDYTFINKKELISMSEEGYLKKSSIGSKFIKEFSSMFVMEKDDLIENMNILALEIQYRNSDEILKDLLSDICQNLSKEDQNRVGAVINKLIKNIRLWKYKGESINEKEGNNKPIVSEKTVGRNDPCPCGSGKKYKKCCG